MKKSYYAKIIKEAVDSEKQKLKAEEMQKKSELIRRLLTTIYQSAAVTLNEEFGFGADRIVRFRDGLNRTIEEYGVLLNEVDADYADGKLEQRYKAIMGYHE